jgi:hypothetical protein
MIVRLAVLLGAGTLDVLRGLQGAVWAPHCHSLASARVARRGCRRPAPGSRRSARARLGLCLEPGAMPPARLEGLDAHRRGARTQEHQDFNTGSLWEAGGVAARESCFGSLMLEQVGTRTRRIETNPACRDRSTGPASPRPPGTRGRSLACAAPVHQRWSGFRRPCARDSSQGESLEQSAASSLDWTRPHPRPRNRSDPRPPKVRLQRGDIQYRL